MWNRIKSFLNSIGTGIKLVGSFIVALFSALLFFKVRNQSVENEEERTKEFVDKKMGENQTLKNNIKENNQSLKDLNKKERTLLRIVHSEDEEVEEELDEFFDKRGF